MTESTMPGGVADRLDSAVARLMKVTSDFDFLRGQFDVDNRRLKQPLTNAVEWEEFPATARAETYFDGAVSIDEMYFPTLGSFGMSVRLFDPEAQDWTVYWVNSQSGKLQPPVRGRWVDGVSLLFGDDECNNVPVRAHYRWSDVAQNTARWQQAFSTDGGAMWETNWVMAWVRRSPVPDNPNSGSTDGDFGFLVGQWDVTHRRLSKWLSGSDQWTEFSGTARSQTYFNGAASIDEYDFPTLGTRGLALRLFDPEARVWSIYWVSSRDGQLGRPVHGAFEAGVGEFHGDDEHDGQPVRARFLWTDLSDSSARWQQAFSVDDGKTWETNWHMDFSRR